MPTGKQDPAANTEGAQGSGKSEIATEVAPPELSRAVIGSLAQANEPMSIREIERKVGTLLGTVGPEPVEKEVKALESLGIIERAQTSRTYALTNGGANVAQGIKILSRA